MVPKGDIYIVFLAKPQVMYFLGHLSPMCQRKCLEDLVEPIS